MPIMLPDSGSQIVKLWANGFTGGIIVVNSTQSNFNQCDKYATAAEKETCIEQLEYDKKIKNYMDTKF